LPKICRIFILLSPYLPQSVKSVKQTIKISARAALAVKGRHMLKAVIFDLDETLISSADAILIFFRRLFEYIDEPFPVDKQEYFYTGSEKGILEKLIPDPAKRELARKFKEEVYDMGGHLNHLELKPYAAEAVAWCAGRYRLAIATNRGDSTPAVLEHFGLAQYFEYVVHARTLAWPKPYPIVVETILDRLAVEARECVLVGDSEFDVMTARNGGIRCVIVGPDRHCGGDWHINSLAELPQLLESIESD